MGSSCASEMSVEPFERRSKSYGEFGRERECSVERVANGEVDCLLEKIVLKDDEAEIVC